MDEIKFRVWDKVNNKMYEYGTDKACILWENGCDMMGMSFISCQPNVIWMQYIGLKDKNNKEIYKGDIVSAFNGKIKAEIIRGYCGFEFKWLGDTGIIRNRISEEIFKNTSLIFEVIGNIYENPELLEE